ncbi:molybdopterin-synthase adenylyltransferase MoeB [Costertonia aggregata]|uniref:Molybdopterin-synthase adenylyltransferase n=1 Tax=Costertonia aggregata TaxID=343403 RepID=A0A7H9AMU6_9FLAO|nr:molybdopterin-synthase adenylyltransferase MoeB [Costertonia aggregata]QLG44776.1 molybdopterin-synthase adenylyltransferase MoeB [Costertonia aggregata]
MTPNLSKEELKRYSRHVLLPEVGAEGQQKLKNASVLVVGLGGLGSPLAMYLAAAGIGTLGLVDFDTVDMTNLQRQTIHGTADVGRSKIESAFEKLHDINPEIVIVKHDEPLTTQNAMEIISGYDIVADGTDNFETRYLVNDACILLGKPNVYGSVYRFEGQASIFGATNGPCYRCLYPDPPAPGVIPSCGEAGVLGVLPGVIGTIQATEVVKLILGKGSTLTGRLLLYDAFDMKFDELKLKPNPDCPMCGENPSITELLDYEVFCNPVQKNDTLKVDRNDVVNQITVKALSNLLHEDADFFLLDVREPFEHQICNISKAVLLPFNDIAMKISMIPKDKKVVVFCHRGGRSERVVKSLMRKGYTNVFNLMGGIDRYAEEIDNEMERY